ncbi:hypothetical protein VPHD526_0008 [Vibrio phage D526]
MIKLIPWSDAAERGLVVSAGEDMAIIKNQVLNGVAQLWEHNLNGTHGFIVTRLDVEGLGTELVLVLGEGSGLNEAVPLFKQVAADMGINSIRVHVKRKGLIRMFSRHDFEVEMYVLRSRLNG